MELWDADPDVCCRYFQTGACAHTEVFDEQYDVVASADLAAFRAQLDEPVEDEPF